MGRQVGFDSQGAAGGMRQNESPGVQVKIAGQAFDQCGEGHVLVGFLVFLVAQDGGLDGDAVDAELVGAAGERLQFEPGQLAGGVVEGLVVGDGAGAVGVVAVGGGGAFAAGAADAFQGQVDAALDRDGAAGDDGPVGFLDVAAAEEGGELAGGAGGAGEQQDAGGVAVEAVDEAGAVFGAEAQRVEHGVEVAGDAGAALDGQAVGLVDREDVVVLVDDGVVAGLWRRGGRRGLRPGFGGASIVRGRWTDWPGSRRALVSALAPSTRIWPVRHNFWMRLCWVPGKWRRTQRSRRMSASSSVTVRVWRVMAGGLGFGRRGSRGGGGVGGVLALILGSWRHTWVGSSGVPECGWHPASVPRRPGGAGMPPSSDNRARAWAWRPLTSPDLAHYTWRSADMG